MEFARNAGGMLMHQRKYTLELISDLGLGGSKPSVTPVELHLKLTTHEFDLHVGSSGADSLLADPSEYQQLVGRLLYLTIIRPDISFAVQHLSQFMHAPKASHMKAAVRVVKYVKQAPGLGLYMAVQIADTLQAYCDADWGSCINTRKSITGYMIQFGSALLSWKSKKQPTISRSSAEAEYRSLASTIAEVVQAGLVMIQYLPTQEQPADILTKGLSSAQHAYLVSKLGLKNIFIPPSLKGGIEDYDYDKQVAAS
ncbi:uncharacterized mitochondrial protein AtMg00810-like [Solanum stenotomum]|uniref:uncharacterized mitochondrial protein AtMg00810-like n=1 Tax=Solanum stenotomum TaxID=172797 RepID=UPI0020D1F2C7|nr:uncharacterized mitochondrial protein AtMg00810-like [Solanum stenotomum]